jgi:hypothetical protein
MASLYPFGKAPPVQIALDGGDDSCYLVVYDCWVLTLLVSTIAENFFKLNFSTFAKSAS